MQCRSVTSAPRASRRATFLTRRGHDHEPSYVQSSCLCVDGSAGVRGGRRRTRASRGDHRQGHGQTERGPGRRDRHHRRVGHQRRHLGRWQLHHHRAGREGERADRHAAGSLYRVLGEHEASCIDARYPDAGHRAQVRPDDARRRGRDGCGRSDGAEEPHHLSGDGGPVPTAAGARRHRVGSAGGQGRGSPADPD